MWKAVFSGQHIKDGWETYGVNGIIFFLHQSVIFGFLCGYFVIKLKLLNDSVLQHWMEHSGTGTGDQLVGTY